MASQQELTVLAVVPAYNERGKIGRVVRKLRDSDISTCVVDDASTDGTGDEAQAAGADFVVRHDKNRGVGAAIRTGIAKARRHGFEAVVIVSGDDQHEPREIPALLGALDRCDLAQGSRYLPGGSAPGMPRSRRWLTRLYSHLFRMATGFPSTDATNGLRLFRLKLLDDLAIDLSPAWLDTYELEPYLLYQVVRRGARVHEVPCTVRYHARESSTKMIPILDWWRLLRPLVYLRLGLRK